jgi:hypothetical protein
MTRMDKLACAFAMACLLWGLSGCDAAPLHATADAATEASPPMPVVPEAAPSAACGPGYERVLYKPQEAWYCMPIEGIDGGAPCGAGYPISWLGEGVIRCAFDAGSAE